MLGIRLSSAIRLHYLRALFAQNVHVLDSMPPGSATITITNTSNTLQLGVSEKLGVFVEYTSTMIAAIVVAFTYNWSLTLVTFSALLFITLTVALIMPFIIKGHERVTEVCCPDPHHCETGAELTRPPEIGRVQGGGCGERSHGQHPHGHGVRRRVAHRRQVRRLCGRDEATCAVHVAPARLAVWPRGMLPESVNKHERQATKTQRE